METRSPGARGTTPPGARADMQAGPAPESAALEDAAAARILIVDDEPTVAAVLHELLASQGYQVSVCRSGEAAVEEVPGFLPDLVLTDINLPGISGLEVLRFAKGLDPEVIVVLVTGQATTSNAIAAVREGAYDYVTKPFDLNDVLQIVERGVATRRLQRMNRRLLDELRQANQTLQRHEHELREKVALATWQMTTLYEVGKEIGGNLELEPRLKLVTARAGQLAAAQGAAVYLRQENTDEYLLASALNLEPTPLEGEKAGFITGEGINGRAAIEQRAVRQHSAAGSADLQLPGFGSHRFSALLAVPMVAEGHILGVMNVMDKIGPFTEEDEHFMALFAAQAAIAIHNSQLFERTKSLDRLKSEFVAVVSHEIRTPLTSIKGAIELLSDARYFEVSEQQKKLLSIAYANSERLLLLINDILDFSKLEAGRLTMSRERQNLEPLLQHAVNNLRTLIEEGEIHVGIEVQAGLPDVMVDANRILQVVTNLLGNAIKFSPPEGRIMIAADRWEGQVRVGVRDHGEGIAAKDVPKLFQKFSQLDSTSTRPAGGAGLGLVICKGIVEQHGGQIWVESTQGEGSVFYFTLPAAGAESVEASAPGSRGAH
jgi:signal transduction histidine kinase/DNA-binding response OmpR family regulator